MNTMNTQHSIYVQDNSANWRVRRACKPYNAGDYHGLTRRQMLRRLRPIAYVGFVLSLLAFYWLVGVI